MESLVGYPRILVISNNSFSKTGSNGRTLTGFFQSWPKSNVAQFCISTDAPNYDVCENYYLVTDKSAFDGFLRFKKAKRCDIESNLNSKGNSKVTHNKVVHKSPSTVWIRNFIWQPERWKSKEFIKWVDDFNPEVILLMNSDSVFILKVAISLSRNRKIPLVLFNTEGFYFFKKPFIESSRLEYLLFKFYQTYYRKVFVNLMKKVSLTFYANSKLQEDYENVFGGHCMILYTGSSIIPPETPKSFNAQSPVFSYIGNLAYSRIDALIEVAEVLQSISSDYVLDVYGRYDEEIKEKAKAVKGLCLKGFISSDKVLETINKSDVLFHAETQDPKWAEALKYGFSTKIADSVSSGKCFVMYSSRDIAGADYIVKTGAGWHASNMDDLRKVLLSIINDKEERDKVLEIARETAIKHHQAQTNSNVFQEALTEVLKNHENSYHC